MVEIYNPGGLSDTDIPITNGVDTVQMRLDADMGLGGDPRACGEFFLTGVVSQFTSQVPPVDNYSVIPRGFFDMVLKDAADGVSVNDTPDDNGGYVRVTFNASPRDVANSADPIGEYLIFQLLGDAEPDSVGAVTADNSLSYSVDGETTELVVIAFSAAGCGLWSDVFNGVSEDNTPVRVVDKGLLPETYAISANYPNPFNPTTVIDYQVPENANVKIVIFNLLGERVATLVNEEMQAGFYTSKWNGRTDSGKLLSSGIYFYKMVAGDFSRTQKMMFLK